jgi:hypothetical protein
MINQATSKIVKEFSLKYSDGIIKQSLYSTLDQKAFDIIRQQFSLNESRLKHIDCPSCDNQCKIKIKPNKISFIHCLADGCGTLKDLKNNEDLAYQITLNGVADLLIKLLGIKEQNKRTIKSGELIYLGKKELESLSSLALDVYFVRNDQGKKAFLNYYQPQSKTTPAIIIRLSNKNLNFEEKQIVECWFDDLVVYDGQLIKFQINQNLWNDLISNFKATKDLENYQKIVKDNNKIKYGKGGKIKAEKDYGQAKEYVLKEYQNLKNKNRTKKDISKIISNKFPTGTFPVIPTDETIYRWLLKV